MVAEAFHLPRLRHVEDQGIVLGAALGLEDPPDRVAVQAVGAQAVYRLRGDGHQAAVLENFRRNRRGIRSFGG